MQICKAIKPRCYTRELFVKWKLCFESVLKSARKKFLESPGLSSPRKETGIRDQRKIFDLGEI